MNLLIASEFAEGIFGKAPNVSNLHCPPHTKRVETKFAKTSERRKRHEGGVDPDEDQGAECRGGR